MRGFATAFVAVPLSGALFLATPVSAQVAQPTPESLQSALTDVLSLLSGGWLSPREHPAQVTRDGDIYRISIPLPGLSTPPNAAINAVARPVDGGLWDVTSMTLPPTGTMPLTEAGQQTQAGTDTPGTLSFSIGQQTIHARIDPALIVLSPFAADLHDVTLRTESRGRHAEQVMERYTLDGTVSGGPDQRLNIQSQGSAVNWRIDTLDKAGTPSTGLIRSAAGSFNVEGLDRAQAERLTTAGRSFATDLRATMMPPVGTPAPDASPPGIPAPGIPPTGMPPTGRPAHRTPTAGRSAAQLAALRTQLRAMIDACTGLLTRLEVEETLQQIHFEAGGANHGDIGQVHFALTGEARNNRLNAQVDVMINDPSLGTVPADLVAYVPRHIDIKPAVKNVHVEQLLRLLRDATAEDADQAALQAQAMALLDDPATRVGIESLEFSSGPLQVAGSAQLRPQKDGKPGVDIHLTATGVDALIAGAQGNPRMQGILPMVFVAKGMARAQGDSLVWDISLGAGAATVNGVPLGHAPPGQMSPGQMPPGQVPPGRLPPARPPSR
jgi:hypothetical protein